MDIFDHMVPEWRARLAPVAQWAVDNDAAPAFVDVLVDWSRNRVCALCNVQYNEYENLGTWGCKNHPLDYNRSFDGRNNPRDTYECCGRSEEREHPRFFGYLLRGCTRSDHSVHSAPFTEADDVLLPVGLAEVLNRIGLLVSLDAVIEDDDNVRLRRYDFRAAADRIEFGRIRE